jgi:hypothetical protein
MYLRMERGQLEEPRIILKNNIWNKRIRARTRSSQYCIGLSRASQTQSDQRFTQSHLTLNPSPTMTRPITSIFTLLQQRPLSGSSGQRSLQTGFDFRQEEPALALGCTLLSNQQGQEGKDFQRLKRPGIEA